MKKITNATLAIFAILLIAGCKKEDSFLNTKPNQALFVPASLTDLENMLNSQNVFNTGNPGLGDIAAEEYYVSSEILDNEDLTNRNGYIWAKQLYETGQNINDWSIPYQQVYYANTILDYLPKISVSPAESERAEQIRGRALFFRAMAFYNLVQTFAMPYDPASAGKDPGIPLRLSSDLNQKSTRASIQQCYDRIKLDLQTALPLLPVKSTFYTLPSQPAANGLLARVSLATFEYDNAFRYADASLKQFSTLTDYNTLDPSPYGISSSPLSEDFFHTTLQGYDLLIMNYEGIANSTLYGSYDSNDLRKSSCFVENDGLPYFSGSYDQRYANYGGMATDEMFLIKAECSARAGKTSAALKDLNDLLVKRWKTGTFKPYEADTPDAALHLILSERRKELLYRGLRWTDLRRLNKDPRFAVTLERTYKGTTYSLPPNDPRYAMPIPDNEIKNSRIQQNPR